ncbi:MAG TPA: LTA synthase family protein [Methylomirabilota bacterium]|jgi:phosphoglycerol transferase MdoB-like AlkP superfamily enzyme|nr:LTA synthase family protein [Methylomirabilota bacterium]
MAARDRWSFGETFVFWWVLLLVIQQAQRLTLVIGTGLRGPPRLGLLAGTLATGLRADLVSAGFGIAGALLVGVVTGSLVVVARAVARRPLLAPRVYTRALGVTSAALAVVVFLVLTLDMGYYRYSQSRLDFVFFEYIGDVLDQFAGGAALDTQVGRQTTAEARDAGHWPLPVAGYLALEAGAVAGWWLAFTRRLRPALATWSGGRSWIARATVALVVAAGAWGLHPGGPDTVQSAGVSDSTYYVLAQNPLWYVGMALQDSVRSHAPVPPSVLAEMPERRAFAIAQAVLSPGAKFLDPRYPLVRVGDDAARPLGRTPNVLLIFVEALDRRYLQRTEAGVRVTPFLDRLADDSVTFEHFLSNGAQTFHGLFATFCSALPRHGIAATKAHHANDYLCLPSLLRRGGYRTEMVIGQNRDRNHSRLGLFMARNGLDELIDETGFPADAPRMGLGMTDGALFDRLLAEIRRLRGADRPYFLAALTTGTHHPFEVPDRDPEVTALRAQPDRYLPALRYVDGELERFFTVLRRDGLLRDTVVLILGDHGRHEPTRGGRLERAAGHFMSPLLLWVDPSLRSASTYRPRRVSGLASQLDLAPTILGLAGLAPRVSSFVGRDVSCVLASDCLPDRSVYLSDVYDNLIGVADREGFWFYSLDAHTVGHVDLDVQGSSVRLSAGDPAVTARAERILALYVTSNMLIETNRLWSWKEFGPRL